MLGIPSTVKVSDMDPSPAIDKLGIPSTIKVPTMDMDRNREDASCVVPST
jgi:hypothetical protein